jgi:hypothetical protein
MPRRKQPKTPLVTLHVADLLPVLPEATLLSEYKAQLGLSLSESTSTDAKPLVGFDHVTSLFECAKKAKSSLLF